MVGAIYVLMFTNMKSSCMWYSFTINDHYIWDHLSLLNMPFKNDLFVADYMYLLDKIF